MRRQKKPTFAINIRFSHFAPIMSLPRTLFPCSQTLYTRYSGLNGSTMHCCK